jgi:hypothetical protein
MQTANPVKNGQAAQQVPIWKPELLSYDAKDLRVLTFPSDEAVYTAIDLLWSPGFQGMPFDFASGGCLIIPAEGVPLFAESGVPFTADTLLSKEELIAAERRELSQHGPF